MSMVIGKKQLLAATLALALGSAVFVNWYYNRVEKTATGAETTQQEEYAGENLGDSLYVQGSTSENTEKEKNGEDETVQNGDSVISTAGSIAEYFASAQLERDKAHDEIKDFLREACESKEADSNIVSKAQAQLEEFENAVKLECDTENLIKAKLDCECLVAVNNGRVEIVVSPGVLDSVATLQISEIIKEQTGINGENISIIEAK